MQKLADHGTDFLREAVVTLELICKLVPWDLASQDDLKAVAAIIMGWRLNAQRAIGLTPRGGHRMKQQNTMPTLPCAENTSLGNVQGIAQPSFSPARMQRGRPGAMAAVAELCKHRLLAIQTFFATSTSADVPSQTIATRSTSGAHPVPLQLSAPHPPSPVAGPSNLPNNTAYLPYHSGAYLYLPPGSFYSQMYPMYSLPPRYYPPAPNSQSRNP
jgi:hypothetical protein